MLVEGRDFPWDDGDSSFPLWDANLRIHTKKDTVLSMSQIAILKLNYTYMCLDIFEDFSAYDIVHHCTMLDLRDASGVMWLLNDFVCRYQCLFGRVPLQVAYLYQRVSV